MAAVLLRKEEYKKKPEVRSLNVFVICRLLQFRRPVRPLTSDLDNNILEAQRFHFNKGCLIDFLTLLLINAPFQKSVNE